MLLLSASGTAILGAYVLAFGAAAVACFASLGRARLIEDPDVRRGLMALLLTSGGWALAHVGFLLVPTPGLKRVFYHAGLIVGFSTVGPWLYFCSAYSGRTLHRAPALRRVAVGVFLGVVSVKVTNPLHGLYFRAEYVTAPFPHLAVSNQPLHWLTMALAYALATVGYFMLLELFWEVGYRPPHLLALAGVTGLPVLLDVAALLSPLLLEMTYEPLGVAAFAVGVLFVFLKDFQTVKFAGEYDDPVIVLDDADRVRDYNAEAKVLFPSLEVGEVISATLPEISTHLDDDDGVLEIDRAGGMRYYRLSVNPFTAGATEIGRAITLADVTDREQYRREIERQNERLSQFANMISHDLRNPLGVAIGRVELAREEYDSEHLDTARTALARMESLIEDLLTLARHGQPIDETERVSLSTVADRSWEVVETKDATLSVESDLAFLADPDRLQQLLENLIRNSVEHGSTGSRAEPDDSVEHGSTGNRTASGDSVEHGSTSNRTQSGDAVEQGGTGLTVRIGALPEADGFYVEDDGPGIPETARDKIFEAGHTTAEDGTGFGLAIVAEIVDAHGWEIGVADGDGARFEITGVTADPD